MMSRYSGGNNYDYSPPSTPRGRRYILRNFNARKQRKVTYPARRNYDEYDDIAKAPSTQGSQISKTSNHVGTSNRVVPTDNAAKSPRKVSPRKTPREPPVFVFPRKDAETYAKNQTPRTDINANITESSPKKEAVDKSKDTKTSPRKETKDSKTSNKENKDTKTSPRKDKSNKKTDTTEEMPVRKTNDKGLTPRDEYMVTKLYNSQIIFLKPSEVRYTHDQITTHFSDGRSMLSTFVAFLYGRVEIRLGGNDIPPIEVMQVEEPEGKLWYVVNGNRRLFIFRRLERCGALDSMQVIARKYDTVEMDKHFLTRNHGRKISVINDSQLDGKFKNEVQKWREKGGKKILQNKGKRKRQQTPQNKQNSKYQYQTTVTLKGTSGHTCISRPATASFDIVCLKNNGLAYRV